MIRKCDFCGRQFKNLIDLYDHKREHPEWRKAMTESVDWLIDFLDSRKKRENP